MSAIIYSGERENMETSEDYSPKTQRDNEEKSAAKPNDIRLQDIEEQLEMAESRCNNLKNQLDYMKKVYGVNRNKSAKSKKVSELIPKKESSTTLIESITSSEESKTVPLKSSAPSRQKSNAIGTDNTGAAVRTINNILNGITNSVNRLSEIHSQLATPRAQISMGISPKTDNDETKGTKDADVGTIPAIKIESSSAIPNKQRAQKRKAINKTSKTCSQSTIKRSSRMDKKIRSALSRSSGILEKKSSTYLKSRFQNKFTNRNNLVEIYHNDAVKHSDSDESNLKKSRQHERTKSPRGGQEDLKEVPPLNINVLNPAKDGQISKTDRACPNGYSQAFGFDPPNAPRTTVSCCYSKNYELPTVASRMKQVAKSYLGTLNLKTIPFCAAISTTQSHNIGINIQQVMNIIKNRQPINGISPTLAHNIGLAAEKLNNKPFSDLVSSINSRITQTASRCPLSKTYFNLQQLQEQAKNVPEDTIDEGDEEEAESPKAKTIIITGPSGDMEIKMKNEPVWRVEKNSTSEQCTCLAQPNVGFQQVAGKYQRNNRPSTEHTLESQIIENQLKTRLRRYKITKNQYPAPVRTSLVQESQVQTINPKIIHQETQKEDSLRGRERSLKEVLTNLHRDFEALNKKYEDVSEKSQTDGNEDAMKELERLETELGKKEEEINMVMTLYKEVLALKQQVKQLKERRSQASLPSKDPKEAKMKFKEYNNPEAAFHLTKLLRQIQHYQMRYKTNLSDE